MGTFLLYKLTDLNVLPPEKIRSIFFKPHSQTRRFQKSVSGPSINLG